MTKICCWLVAGLLFLAPTTATATASGPVIPIITVQGDRQLATYFDGSSWVTTPCPIETEIQGLPAWGGTDYIRLGDFNGNGTLDIASPRADTVMIKSIDPLKPGWEFTRECLVSIPPLFVTNQWGGSNYTWVGDFNGDRKDDLASANGSSVYMKLANSNGYDFLGFTSQTWPVALSWGGSDYTWVGDFNGDGRDDIASAYGGSVYMKISTGTGFVSQTWYVTNEWGGGAYTKVGDFNGDGLTDIASPSAGQVYMKISTGTGFTSATWYVSNTWGGAGYTWVADFNRDGRADIASADAGIIRMKLSQGTFFSSQDWPVTNLWGGASYTWMLDYDADGYKDIVSAEPYRLHTKRNDQGTSFVSATWPYYGYWSVPEFTWALGHSRYSWLP